MLDNQHERNQDRFGDMHMDGKHHPALFRGERGD